MAKKYHILKKIAGVKRSINFGQFSTKDLYDFNNVVRIFEECQVSGFRSDSVDVFAVQERV